ncbi:MAG: hypothetical protein H5T64_02820 [Chloroflexi bacterium]|nr:hypothetical protein [Chloroflexota bacterium]
MRLIGSSSVVGVGDTTDGEGVGNDTVAGVGVDGGATVLDVAVGVTNVRTEVGNTRLVYVGTEVGCAWATSDVVEGARMSVLSEAQPAKSAKEMREVTIIMKTSALRRTCFLPVTRFKAIVLERCPLVKLSSPT